jgi:hypothetical protein
MAKPKKEKGFILIVMLFLLLLVAITAMSLNAKSGLQAKMTANQSADTQTYFGQLAVMEQAAWELTKNPLWRTTGEPKPFQGETFTLTAASSSISGYTDAVDISVTAGASKELKTALRYLSSTEYTGFNQPGHIELAADGYLYVADTSNHRVKKIDMVTGAITTIAGTGIPGYDVDGFVWGTTLNKQLNQPRGIFVGSSGIYIADTVNHRVRKVTTGSFFGFPWIQITTIAGISGSYSDSGLHPPLGDWGDADEAQLNLPSGVALDTAGNIYIADTGNNRIRKVNALGIITTFAGGGGGPALTNPDPTKWRLSSPRGVFADASGNVYIADTGNHVIRKVSAGGFGSLIAGAVTVGYSGDGGPATSAILNNPVDIFMDTVGNLHIADSGNQRVRCVSGQNGYIYTIARTGNASIALPRTRCGRMIYVSDRDNNRIRVLTLKREKKLYK